MPYIDHPCKQVVKLLLFPLLLISAPLLALGQGYWLFTGDIVRNVDNNDPKYPRTTYKIISSDYNNLAAEQLDIWNDGVNWNKYGGSFNWTTENELKILKPGERLSITGTLTHSYSSSRITPWGEATGGVWFDDYGLIKSAVKFNLPVLTLKAATNSSKSGTGSLAIPSGPLGTKMTTGKYQGKYLIVLRSWFHSSTSMAIDRVYEWVPASLWENPPPRGSSTIGWNKISLLRGSATLIRGGRRIRIVVDENGEMIHLGATYPFQIGDRFEVDARSILYLRYSDGAEVRVFENSVIEILPNGINLIQSTHHGGKVKILMVKEDRDFRCYTVGLRTGLLKYQYKTKEGKIGRLVTRTFQARSKETPETEFFVVADREGNSTVYAIKNSVWVEDLQGQKQTVLVPGQRSTVALGGLPTPPVQYSRSELAKLLEEESQTETPRELTAPMGPARDFFNTFNPDAVNNDPTAKATFTLSESTLLTLIQTYHWNNGRGAVPGTISLQAQDGRIYGPWKATGSEGSEVKNVFWTALPNVQLPAGTYTLIDSDPGTWSQNRASGGRGFVLVKGRVY